MGSILTAIEDSIGAANREQEAQVRKAAVLVLEGNFDWFLQEASSNDRELAFWQWVIANKDKIARNRQLIDLIG